MSNNSQHLRLHAAVRLLPPGSDGVRQWRAINLDSLRQYQMSRAGAALCVAFAQRTAVDDGVAEVAAVSGLPADKLRELAGSLQKAGVLLDDTDDSDSWVRDLLTQWHSYGWLEAADHHLATFDYPYFDYSLDGPQQDELLMARYHAEQPDVRRYNPARGPVSVAGPSAEKATTTLETPADICFNGSVPPRQLDREALLTLTSVVFGATGDRPTRIAGAARVLHRTSPSGGARHPSEGYVYVLDVAGIEPGLYQFSVGDQGLVRLPCDEDLRPLLFGPFRARFPVRAVYLITSDFDRNAYRYREPRTFRTVVMDVGHLVATTELAASALGLSAYGHHGFDDHQLELALGVSGLREGLLYTVAVGDGLPQRENSEDENGQYDRAGEHN